MKQKLLSVLIAVVLGLSLTPAIPASAASLTGVSATSDNYTAGATANYTIAFKTATSGNITTIDMAFAAEFDVSGVTLGTVTGIGSGSIGVLGNTVNYTVSSPVNVTSGMSVSIGLSNIVNPTASGAYNITITTKDNFVVEIDSGTASVTIDPGDATNLGVTGITDPIFRGVTSDVTVTAYDDYQNVATGYNGTIIFTSSDTAATLPSSYPFVPGDNGRRTFIDGVTFDTVGEQWVTATDTAASSINGTQSDISVGAIIKVPGGGVGAPPPGVTKVISEMSSEGKFRSDVTCESEDECVELFIPEDTIGKGPNDGPLFVIKILEAEDPPPAPENTCCIGLVYDIGPSGATFDPPISLTIRYDEAMIPEGVNEENLAINFWDEEAGEWDGLVCTVDVENNTTTACVSHFTPFALVASTRPAAFETSYLTVLPREVEPGEEVTVKVKVANTGDLSESYEVNLRINEVVEATQEVTLAGGSSQKVTFTAARDTAGVFTVDVDGQSGSFIVKEEAPVVEEIKPSPPPAVAPVPEVMPAPPPEPEYNWGLIIGWLIVGIVVIGLITCFIVIRRIKAKGGG